MSSNIKTKILIIANMTCVNCENIIERALTGKPGIISISASYSNGTATVTYDESMISMKHMEEILEKEDYIVKKDTNEAGYSPSTNSQAINYNSNNNANDRNRQNQGNQQDKDYTNIIGVGIILFALYMVGNRLGLFQLFNSFPLAKEGMGYGMLFLIGVLTSVHCVAMCGGICLTQCVPKTEGAFTNRFAAMRPSLLYNFGRVISYTVIGGIVGAIGSVVSFSGAMQGMIQILAGVFMVIMGLNMLNIFPWLRKLQPRMPKIFAKKIYAQRNSNSPLYIGLLNGLMPCGPLQAMQIYALSTGSPLKGAISMFLFSVGTVPLMFAFGALSSFLSKKFTAKMMSVSAVLVVFLGIFMFNNGVGLSGIVLPNFPASASTSKVTNVATIQNDIQVVTTELSSGSYEPIVVQAGIPVKWTIRAEAGDINGCNNSIIIQKYNLRKDLRVGDNVIEFTPIESGTVPFSCWMGMIRSKITVVDDLNSVDSKTITDTDNSSGSDSSSDNGGLSDYNNLLDVQIPTDQIAVAESNEDGTQSVEITYDKNGFSPAVIVVQAGMETVWNINAVDIELDKSTLLFPYYSAQLDVVDGENPIRFIPDQDFDFFNSDSSFYGYVKVVDDITQIDLEEIKEEISEYQPSQFNGFSQGVGASCH